MNYLRVVVAIAWKDLLIEFRTWDRIAAMGAFAVLVGVLFNYSMDPSVVRPRDVASGLIWMTVIFGGMLGIGRSFQADEEDGAMEGILLSPIPRDALYFGKVLANYALLLFVVLLIFLVFGLFFGLRLEGSLPGLVLIVSLGVLGFVALSTLFSAFTSRSRMGETILPVLVFPLLIPVVIYGATSTFRLFQGRPWAEVAGSARVLGAFAILALAAGGTLFRFVVEE